MTDLGAATWPEVAARDATILVVPLGSLEQHGPHLPLDTDTVIASAVAARLGAQRSDVVVGPPIAYGASGEHAGFAGTLSIGQDGLERTLVELVRSADHFAGVVIVNGHGGNNATLRSVAVQLAGEGRRLLPFVCGVPGGDAHAGRTETSIMLALAPARVRRELAEVGNTAGWDELRPTLVRDGVAAVSPNGVLGDPTGASAEEGAVLIEGIVSRLAEAVALWADE